MRPQLRFQRFEFKYLLDRETEEVVREAIRPFMRLDRYAEGLPGDAYEVVSLYYDTPGLRYYNEKIDGIKVRKKVRLRAYRNGGVPSHSVFLEIKRKQGPAVLKDRCRFPLAAALESGSDLEELMRPHETDISRDLLDELRYENALGALRPTALVVYDREPYEGIDHPKLRVTFDRRIRCREDDRLFPDDGEPFEDCSDGMTVMEVKYQGILPWFLRDVITSSNLERTANSKYCTGLERYHALTRLDLWT